MLYYIARSWAPLGDEEPARSALERAVHEGFFFYPAFTRVPWLDE